MPSFRLLDAYYIMCTHFFFWVICGIGRTVLYRVIFYGDLFYFNISITLDIDLLQFHNFDLFCVIIYDDIYFLFIKTKPFFTRRS